MVFCDMVHAYVELDVDWLYGDRIIKLNPLVTNLISDQIKKTTDQEGKNRFQRDLDYFEPPRVSDIAFRGSDGKFRTSNVSIEYCVNLPMKVEGSYTDTGSVVSYP